MTQLLAWTPAVRPPDIFTSRRQTATSMLVLSLNLIVNKLARHLFHHCYTVKFVFLGVIILTSTFSKLCCRHNMKLTVSTCSLSSFFFVMAGGFGKSGDVPPMYHTSFPFTFSFPFPPSILSSSQMSHHQPVLPALYLD